MATPVRFGIKLPALRRSFTVNTRRLPERSYLKRFFSLKTSSQSCQANLHMTDPPPSDFQLSDDDYFGVKDMVSLAELFKARAHLAHYEGALHPKMEQYIHGSRFGQHVFDLNKSLHHLQVALNVLAHISYQGGIVLMVSTHRQYEKLVQQTARDCGEYFSTGYWRRGSLTNAHKLISNQVVLPDLIIFPTMGDFIYDPSPLVEANMCGLPSIGVVDSNCDPTHVTYRIPGNDDTPSSVELYCQLFKNTINKAKERRKNDHK